MNAACSPRASADSCSCMVQLCRSRGSSHPVSQLNFAFHESTQVFRTYNASVTLDRLLTEQAASDTVDARKADYDRANKEVPLSRAVSLHAGFAGAL